MDEQDALTRLTDDTWDEKEPAWSPDGAHLAFSSDRAHSLVLTAAPRRAAASASTTCSRWTSPTARCARWSAPAGDDGNPA